MKKRISNSLFFKIKLLVSVLLAVLIISYIANIHAIVVSHHQSVQVLNDNMLYQVQSEVSGYVDSVNHVAASLVYAPSVYEYFTMSDRDRILHADEIDLMFLNTILLDEDIKKISLYDKDHNCITDTEQTKKANIEVLDTFFPAQPGFSEAFTFEENGFPYYAFGLPVYDLADKIYGSRIGSALFIMRTTSFDRILENRRITEHSGMYLFDAKGNEVASYSANDYSGSSYDDILTAEGYHIEEVSVEIEGWKLVSLIPENEMIYGSYHRYTNITITYLLVAAMMLILLFLFSKWMFIPLSQLNAFIKNTMNDPDARMPSERTDEIGTVIESLNRMLDEKEVLHSSIQRSQKRMYETELAKRKLQVLAYRNQINPHFLYNTFDCIKAMAVYYDADEIVDLTVSLSLVFRYAVKNENLVQVSDEIKNIKEYAKIIQHRFAGKIRIHVSVDKGVAKKEIIKLLLQPLVENAVFHGVEKNLNGGDVYVTAEAWEEQQIRFQVRDNGVGMSETCRQSVLKQLSVERLEESGRNHGGIGLWNIYGRLKLFYGDEAKLFIESTPGEGTLVTIIVPNELKEEEKKYV